MATLTLKNVPEELIERLKAVALESRRSLNQEALLRLERSLLVRPSASTEEKLAMVRAARERVAHLGPFSLDFILAAKNEGRP